MALTSKEWREEEEISHTHTYTGTQTPGRRCGSLLHMDEHTHICSRLLSKDLWPLPQHADSQCEEPNRKWKDYPAVDCNTTDQRWHSCTLRSARRPLSPPSPITNSLLGLLSSSYNVHNPRFGLRYLTNDVCCVMCPLTCLEEEKVTEHSSAERLCYTNISTTLVFLHGMFVNYLLSMFIFY